MLDDFYRYACNILTIDQSIDYLIRHVVSQKKKNSSRQGSPKLTMSFSFSITETNIH